MLPTVFAVIPFAVLLLMIATGPLLYPHFWHRFYPYIAIGLALVTVSYYVFILENIKHPVEALSDYMQFIMLIGSLYMVSGNIAIKFGCQPNPKNNTAILWAGSLLANIIGTTGASMLLIRPYITLNKKRLRPYHIVFFIFMVSNVGGALTPVADPPLFIGFLKGIPFFWTIWHNVAPWFIALLGISSTFYWLDKKNPINMPITGVPSAPLVHIMGKKYTLLFFLIVSSLFLDPHQLTWLPAIDFQGHKISFIRELILFGIIIGTYTLGNKEVLRANQFSLAPLKEVAFVFIGIFGTMMPAIELVGELAKKNNGYINPDTLYWATGCLSSCLDNAPTYFNFLVAGMSAKGLTVSSLQEVMTYSTLHPALLRATSIASVFFGAMTYIGNGPNFMVRAIAEEQGVKMPSFFGYIGKFSMRYLLPILGFIWVLFVKITWY